MSFTDQMKTALDAKLDASHVKQRKQGGRAVSYVEGWHAIAEANRIFGFDGWTRETVETKETNRELLTLKGESGEYQQWRVGYLCRVRVVARGIVREGTGFGSGIANQNALSDAIESAVKEAETDAMKRALMTFGNPFGLALYDKAQENVEKAPTVTTTTTSKPASTPPQPATADFWSRASYEIRASDLLVTGNKIIEAAKKAPTLDSLLKLEADNDAHMAALKNQAPTSFKEVKTALGEASLRFNEKAA